jgi:hypothetical protein
MYYTIAMGAPLIPKASRRTLLEVHQSVTCASVPEWQKSELHSQDEQSANGAEITYANLDITPASMPAVDCYWSRLGIGIGFGFDRVLLASQLVTVEPALYAEEHATDACELGRELRAEQCSQQVYLWSQRQAFIRPPGNTRVPRAVYLNA